MKYYLLPLLLLVGCQSSQKISYDTIISEKAEWVTYKAKKNSHNKHIVLISGDEEYRSEEALPQLAKILTERHGFDCTVLFAQNPKKPGFIDPNYSFNIPGMHVLKQADLVVLFTRFRALPEVQMQHFENYLLTGNPLIAIRTATHAFNFKDKSHPFSHYGWNYKGNKSNWHLGFGKQILGETWHSHHGHHKHQSTRGIIANGAKNHPLVNGIEDGSMWGPSDVYGIRMPLGGDAQSIILGQTINRTGEFDKNDAFYGMKESDHEVATSAQQKDPTKDYNPNEQMPPIVWTKSYQLPSGKKGTSLTSTIGAATDMADEEVRRLFVNAAYYLLEMPVPKKANVDIVGIYQPSPFAFHNNEHWTQKAMKVIDFMD